MGFFTAAFFLAILVPTLLLLLAGLFFIAGFLLGLLGLAGLFLVAVLAVAFDFATVFAFGFVLAVCFALAFALTGAFAGVFALALAFFTGAFLLFAAIVFFRLSLWTNALGKSSSEHYQNIRCSPSINLAHFAPPAYQNQSGCLPVNSSVRCNIRIQGSIINSRCLYSAGNSGIVVI